MRRSLVLSGGGLAGVAWELGILRGIEDADPELASSLRRPQAIVGTSAGAVVAAQITSSEQLNVLFSAQVSQNSSEIDVELNLEDLMVRFVAATADATGPEDMRRRIGQLALDAPTVSESVRRAVIEARLPTNSWPTTTLRITAVDAATGELVVFTNDSGIELVDAVAASCAVPGVWPPVTIGGRRYIDGGVRSRTNADLAGPSDRVLVITASRADVPPPWGNLRVELAQLGSAEALVIYANEASIAAFGDNPLSLSVRAPSAREGRAIGRAKASDVRTFWQPDSA
jgi:NTE family protein